MGNPRKSNKLKRATNAGGHPPPFSMDQIMRDVQKLLDKQDFATVEEANAFLQNMLKNNGGRVPTHVPDTPLEHAEAIVDQARQQRTPAARTKMARKALAVSPDCAAAYLLLAEHDSHPAKRKALLEQALAAGWRAIAPEMLAEYEREGLFWGRVETRPYMRAAAALAEMAMVMGNRRSAIAEYQRLLRLNPGDNQGLRYLLAHCLLEEQTDLARDALDDLLASYPDDGACCWAYSAALLAFQRGKSSEHANSLLARALAVNHFVPKYLLGDKPMPGTLPTHIVMGDDSEAVDYCLFAINAWVQTPDAIAWLQSCLR